MKKELNFSEALAVFHEAFKKLSDDEQAELSEIYKQRDRLENVTSTVHLVAVYGGT